MISADKLKLYLVLETDFLNMPLEVFLHEVLKAGVKTIQLRDKYKQEEEKIKSAAVIRDITLEYNALFIMNDSIELALKTNADGVHLGVNDGDISEIKKKYNNIITGYSCNNLEDAAYADKYADYAGIGPYAATNTKKDHRAVLGMQGIKNINSHINIPSVAIGGINLDNAKDVLLSNVSGLAVSTYLCRSLCPYDDARRLLDIINERV